MMPSSIPERDSNGGDARAASPTCAAVGSAVGLGSGGIGGQAWPDAARFNAEGFYADLRRQLSEQRVTLVDIAARSEASLVTGERCASAAGLGAP
eukprot:CAMPEP_0204192078 /NCGR_PEP_ID=MMETSP0361-20130328/60577_1 /ASSEMBLY_ACC=CAM_ASM_000343 /TAXON_ID=268821 /ORGANISM="Scrippsiella Hangoei, Strain SHTV-5" /LENGTH=94 /DNA_ID=CAMNT_0051153109 /DNA_START=13 /DNA_END=293 /DNA_ORIENTATION=+